MSPWWLRWYKESARSVGDSGLIPGLGRSPGEVNGNPLQYSCLENPVNRGARWAAVHRVAKSQTCLSDSFIHKHTVTSVALVENMLCNALSIYLLFSLKTK